MDGGTDAETQEGFFSSFLGKKSSTAANEKKGVIKKIFLSLFPFGVFIMVVVLWGRMRSCHEENTPLKNGFLRESVRRVTISSKPAFFP